MPAKPRLRICLTSSEISPLAKTGGLADVTAALAAYFARKGHDCRVLVPFYAGIETDGLEIEELPELADLEKFHPLFLYESIWNLLVFLALMGIARRVKELSHSRRNGFRVQPERLRM